MPPGGNRFLTFSKLNSQFSQRTFSHRRGVQFPFYGMLDKDFLFDEKGLRKVVLTNEYRGFMVCKKV
jgi:hypothetical protein